MRHLSHDSLGVYLAVPFCRAKCSFCNFASDSFAPERMAGYVAALCSEIDSAESFAQQNGLALPRSVDSVYLGGGTPSLLPPAMLQSIFSTLRSNFHLVSNAEITMECAPGQIEDVTLEAAMQLGVSRVSLGVQSFVDRESRAVGRLHTGIQCETEIARLLSHGLDTGFDLICGLPHQTRTSWRESIDRAIATGAHHVSVYMLEVDEDSRLGRELIGPGVRYGAGLVPHDDTVAEMYLEACETLSSEGLMQYEISNFARAGKQSLHNRKYWERAPYLGVGLDAHSMLLHAMGRAHRFSNGDNLDEYLAHEEKTIATVDVVDEIEAYEEQVFLGLRLNDGVETSLLCEVEEQVRDLAKAGLLWQSDGRTGLTPHGRVVSSSVFAELLAVPA